MHELKGTTTCQCRAHVYVYGGGWLRETHNTAVPSTGVPRPCAHRQDREVRLVTPVTHVTLAGHTPAP